MTSPTITRRLPIGAEVLPGGAHFRVWAPKRRRVEVALFADATDTNPLRTFDLRAEPGGYYSLLVEPARALEISRNRPRKWPMNALSSLQWRRRLTIDN